MRPSTPRSALESTASKSPLLEQTRQLLRARHMSIRTEQAYLGWLERFLRFQRERYGRWVHPSELADDDINAFLTRDGRGHRPLVGRKWGSRRARFLVR